MKLLNDVLDFSKIEAGKMKIENVPLSLKELITDVCHLVRPLALGKGLVAVDFFQSDDVPDTVVSDPIRLRQILNNLLNNAVKFTASGKIGIHVTRHDSTTHGAVLEKANEIFLHVAVSDSGIGVPKDKQSAIFEAFQQADGSTTRKYGGTGLGLAICLELVELLGGFLWVESPAPGGTSTNPGSVFHFTWPVKVLKTDSGDIAPVNVPLEPTAVVDTPLSAFEKALPPLRVLVAEDNIINQKTIRALLEKRGHTVVLANDGVDGVARALSGPPFFDLILMDLQMPRQDGMHAAMEIRREEAKKGRETPVVILTARAMDETRGACLAAGMDDFLLKPINPRALSFVVGRTIFKEKNKMLLNLRELFRRCEGDESLVLDLLTTFQRELPEHIERLAASHAARDMTKVHRESHALAGAAANVSAGAVERVARVLELAAQQGDAAACERSLMDLRRNADELSRVLKEPWVGAAPA